MNKDDNELIIKEIEKIELRKNYLIKKLINFVYREVDVISEFIKTEKINLSILKNYTDKLDNTIIFIGVHSTIDKNGWWWKTVTEKMFVIKGVCYEK